MLNKEGIIEKLYSTVQYFSLSDKIHCALYTDKNWLLQHITAMDILEDIKVLKYGSRTVLRCVNV